MYIDCKKNALPARSLCALRSIKPTGLTKLFRDQRYMCACTAYTVCMYASGFCYSAYQALCCPSHDSSAHTHPEGCYRAPLCPIGNAGAWLPACAPVNDSEGCYRAPLCPIGNAGTRLPACAPLTDTEYFRIPWDVFEDAKTLPRHSQLPRISGSSIPSSLASSTATNDHHLF